MTQHRKDPLLNNQIYHIYSRSIAKFEIYNSELDFQRFLNMMQMYSFVGFNYKYSRYDDLSDQLKSQIINDLAESSPKYVNIICYCIMPTHFHLVLKQNRKDAISKYLGNLLNSYSRYFNTKYKRIGPLWSSRFKNVLVNNDEQLLHLTRYIHLNPSSVGISISPEDWTYSSYNEYINDEKHLCDYGDDLEINPVQYRKFVNDRKTYQKSLSIIKKQLIDDYSG